MSNFNNSEKIIIYKNPNGDTRTAPKDISFEEFQKANDMHKQDVKIVMDELAHILSKSGRDHDYTKKLDEKLFYVNFLSTINNGTDFVKDEWYQMHVATERHHLFSDCKADVDLIVVLEMIVDCVCAGKSRSGEVKNLKLDQETLTKAFNNTVEKINNMIECLDQNKNTR